MHSSVKQNEVWYEISTGSTLVYRFSYPCFCGWRSCWQASWFLAVKGKRARKSSSRLVLIVKGSCVPLGFTASLRGITNPLELPEGLPLGFKRSPSPIVPAPHRVSIDVHRTSIGVSTRARASYLSLASAAYALSPRHAEPRLSKPQNFHRFSKVAPTPLSSCRNMLGRRTMRRSSSPADTWQRSAEETL